jgi:methyltransferase (TIGR00027 family)
MRDISATAHLVAMYRALASECPKTSCQDPFARLLAGGQGELLVEVLGEKQQGTNALAIRTEAIDQMIQQLIATKKVGTVLNLGAGLDTRPYRLALPNALHWIEVDLPDILTYKEQKLQDVQPTCQLDRIKLDLTNRPLRQQLFAAINATQRSVLVITEGLLSYLTEQQVAALATDLQQQPQLRWWLLDLASPFLLQESQKNRGQQIFDQYFADGQPTFLFAPTAGTTFFQPYGWQVQAFRSVWSAAQHLQKLPGLKAIALRLFAPKYWQAISQDSGFVLLEQISPDFCSGNSARIESVDNIIPSP